MRGLVVLVVLFLTLGLAGCPTPTSYVKATELGLENSVNLDKNSETLALNYFSFISKDTQRMVEAGEMKEETRKEVLDQVKEQMATLKEQAFINRKFVLLAHDRAHDSGLSIEDILAAIQTVNKATPEILEFYDKMKGGN